MLSSRSSLALVAALALSAGAAPVVLANQLALVSAAPRLEQASKRSRFSSAHTSVGSYRGKNPSLSAAQQKRISKKKRNVARNRAIHR